MDLDIFDVFVRHFDGQLDLITADRILTFP